MKTFSNIDLELEYFAGRVLSYQDYPAAICTIANVFASFPDIEYYKDPSLLQDLKSKLVTEQGRLNKQAIYKFFRGDAPELLEQLKICHRNLMESAINLDIGEKALTAEYIAEVYQLLDQNLDFGNLGKLVQTFPTTPQFIRDMDLKRLEYSYFVTLIESVVPYYGTGENVRVARTVWPVTTRDEMIETCNVLPVLLMNSNYPSKIIVTVLNVCEATLQTLLQEPLNPLYTDYAKEFYKIASEPEEYPRMVHEGDICTTVGDMFASLYPQYVVKASEPFFAHFTKLPEDEKIVQSQGLGLAQNYGDLTNLCSQFVTRIYRQ